MPSLVSHNFDHPSSEITSSKDPFFDLFTFNMILNDYQGATLSTNDSSACSTIASPKLLEIPSPDDALSNGKANNHGLKPFDVICGRCSLAFNNIGNRRFRIVIEMNAQRYIDAPTRSARSHEIQSVIKLLQEEIGATFVKQQNDGTFIPVSQKIVRQKVGHALRDFACFHSSGTSSSSNVSCAPSSSSSSSSFLPRSSNFREALRRTVSDPGSKRGSISAFSTQSAPSNIIQRPIGQFSSQASLNVIESDANDYCNSGLDEFWADDLSVCSLDRPVKPSEIFPEIFSRIFPECVEF
jgi:hypothetical protein